MAIPLEIQALIGRLTQEVDLIEQQASRGLSLLRPALAIFPNNDILVQFFAYLNNAVFLVEIYRRRIEANVELLSADNVPVFVIQDAAEELGDLLGRALESKMGIERIINRLENLQ